ncbi:hypothetical protein T492DRAFT_283487 [Pavlovales sp. CCMP2436]|nr:hypothetical protein T492DRAFT_283487 [Pavlovales sp. CCMP2436]
MDCPLESEQFSFGFAFGDEPAAAAAAPAPPSDGFAFGFGFGDEAPGVGLAQPVAAAHAARAPAALRWLPPGLGPACAASQLASGSRDDGTRPPPGLVQGFGVEPVRAEMGGVHLWKHVPPSDVAATLVSSAVAEEIVPEPRAGATQTPGASLVTRAPAGEFDVVAGVYEGGFKTWECSLDLCSYLAAEWQQLVGGRRG